MLTSKQIEVIARLNDQIYTVDYIEEFKNCTDNVFVNAPLALIACGVNGYLKAVNNIIKMEDQK